MSLFRVRPKIFYSFSSVDFIILIALSLLVYGLLGVAQEWVGPYQPHTEIDLHFPSLLKYAFLSLVRVFSAYALSLFFTFTYGYLAAKSKKAEPILISILDILQSVPVLSFMPGLVIALVNIFPNSNLGLELATVLMVFTCEGWNMVFSFYSSVKSVPVEIREVSRVFRLNRWEVFKNIELPFSMTGLLWNSMLSMAGGWFYLTVMESFTLGDKNFRLPGIGSYMAVAYENENWKAVGYGILVMITLIICVDRILWAPLVAWSEKYRFEGAYENIPARSLILEWINRSNILKWLTRPPKKTRTGRVNVKWLSIDLSFLKKQKVRKHLKVFFQILGVLAGVLFAVYTSQATYRLLLGVTWWDWVLYLRDTFITFLRVTTTVILGSLWTIPLGVFIGTNPKWSKRLQPVVQIVASFPFPMLFPLLTLAFFKMGFSFDFVAVVLMLFASQWYILFNVISGATLIPPQLMEVKSIFQLNRRYFWTAIVLPAIFPSLVNGWITAAGGAWNSCIVSEFLVTQGRTWMALGIGSTISQATQEGNFPRLAGATITMITTVVLLNRFFWGHLYRLAETRFKLEPST